MGHYRAAHAATFQAGTAAELDLPRDPRCHLLCSSWRHSLAADAHRPAAVAGAARRFGRWCELRSSIAPHGGPAVPAGRLGSGRSSFDPLEIAGLRLHSTGRIEGVWVNGQTWSACRAEWI